MKKCVNRINNKGNYVFDNCQFIEKSINAVKDKYKPIKQLDLNGNLIKIWSSSTEAGKDLGIFKEGIIHCLKGKYKTSYGCKWEYI